jgi:hypothetical protein
MAKEFIEAQIARSKRNALFLGLGLTIGGAAIAALLHIWMPALLFGVPGLLVLASWLKGILTHGSNGVYQQLARYGDPLRLAQEVNREFAGVKPGDGAHFGEKWLASTDSMGMSLAPWGEIAWLYIYAEVRRGYRRNYVKVSTRDGRQFNVLTSEQQAEQLLRDLHAHAPWAEIGFSNELDGQWDEQRAEFVRRVDARKGLHEAVPTVDDHASSGVATPSCEGGRKGIDFRAIRMAVLPMFLFWTLAVLAVTTLARQPGVICATPVAWLLACWVGMQCVSRSRSVKRRALLTEAALAGGLLGLSQGVLFFVIAHFGVGDIKPDERQKAIVLDLIMLFVGAAVAAFLSTAVGAAQARKRAA